MWRIPRRLVRDWDGMTFRRWLVTNDKDALEVSTLAGREAKILDLLRRHCSEGTGPLPLAGAVKDKSICAAPYRITHINTCLGQGGAAKVVELLMRAQKALGPEPKALVGESYIMDDAVYTFDAVPDLCALRTTNAEGLLDYHFRGVMLWFVMRRCLERMCYICTTCTVVISIHFLCLCWLGVSQSCGHCMTCSR